MTLRGTFGMLAMLLILAPIQAQEHETPAEDPAHAELRALRDSLMDAYEKRDIDELLKHIHEKAVITWQNGERNRGPEELREFYRKMMSGEDRIVADVKSKLTINDLSVLYGGDTAVSYGELDDEFKLTNGSQFKLHSRWTATAVREGGQWVISSFHISSNLFDNPILDAAKGLVMTVGAVAGGTGLLLGMVLVAVTARIRKRKA